MNSMTNPMHPLNPISPLNPLSPVWHADDTEQVVEVKECGKECVEQRQFEADLSPWLLGGTVVFLVLLMLIARK